MVHVSCYRESNIYRKTFPIVFADRYDPKEVFTYIGYVLEPSRKLFHAIQRPTPSLTQFTFWALGSTNPLLNHVEHRKIIRNHPLRMFPTIKN